VDQLQMSREHICRLLSSYPPILDYNLESHIMPMKEYFVSELEYSPTEFRSILLKHPRLVTHSMYKIKHLVGVLHYELGLDARQAKRVLFQAPQTLNIDTETNLKCTVEFLRSTFELDEVELRKVLAGMPTLMICSVEKNLLPKIEYLRQEFSKKYDCDNVKSSNNGISGFEHLKEAVITQPTLLGYSLEKRIKPRLAKISAAQVDLKKITVGITMKEDKFDQWLAKRKAKVDLYGPEIAARLSSRRVKKESTISVARSSPSTISLSDDASEVPEKENEEIQRETERRKGRIVHWKR